MRQADDDPLFNVPRGVLQILIGIALAMLSLWGIIGAIERAPQGLHPSWLLWIATTGAAALGLIWIAYRNLTSWRREPKNDLGMTGAQVERHLDEVVRKHLRELERSKPPIDRNV